MAAVNKRLLQPGQRIRVLVVDDSVVIRRLVTRALEQDPSLEVVGAAANGAIALERIPQFNPDVLTLDIEMPEMDGLETLRHIRREYPGLRVIMFSTLTERGATITLEALTLGADDYVTKASNEGSLDHSMARLREELIPKIKQFFCLPGQSTAPRPAPARASGTPAARSSASILCQGRWQGMRAQPRVVAIGVSTGGPTALGAILPQLPPEFPLPVLVVQHMPPLFTRLLAERLHATCRLPVAEASQGEAVESGKILIAPGDFHLKVASDGVGARVCLDQSPQQNSCRPAVDALFASIGEVYRDAAIAVVLTGMGRDGLRGTEILKAQGATILAQDEASSVVWGMPGAVVNAGFADRVLPLDQVVPEILRMAWG
jgi:two-component system, chemotaxis family, protein-glutamate methylesterase/glutaminase